MTDKTSTAPVMSLRQVRDALHEAHNSPGLEAVLDSCVAAIDAHLNAPTHDVVGGDVEAKARDLIKRLRDTPNWLKESWGDWKACTTSYDTAPKDAADLIETLIAAPRVQGDSVSGPMLTSAQGIEFSIRHPAEQTRGDGVTDEMWHAALRAFRVPVELDRSGRHAGKTAAALKLALEAAMAMAPRQAVPDELIADLRKFHEETEACDEFDLSNEATAALLAANLIEGTHFVLTAKDEALLTAPSAGRMGVDHG